MEMKPSIDCVIGEGKNLSRRRNDLVSGVGLVWQRTTAWPCYSMGLFLDRSCPSAKELMSGKRQHYCLTQEPISSSCMNPMSSALPPLQCPILLPGVHSRNFGRSVKDGVALLCGALLRPASFAAPAQWTAIAGVAALYSPAL
jgi:hypothetical protein